MEKRVIIFSLVLILSLSIVSAFSFSDYWNENWNKITGKQVSSTGNCVDSDGGANFSLKGTTSTPYSSETDYCSENALNEFYCFDYQGEMAIAQVKEECGAGCKDGACVFSKLLTEKTCALPGDVSRNGYLDKEDADLISKIVAGFIDENVCADSNQDGEITILDASWVLREMESNSKNGDNLDLLLYPRINVANSDFTIYAKSRDKPISEKAFVVIYDENKNKIKTIELFNDGKNTLTPIYSSLFKMDMVGEFSAKLCLGNSAESCQELLESLSFEVEEFNCKELFEGHNDINSDRINIILVGFGYNNVALFKDMATKSLTFDGLPIITDLYEKDNEKFSQKYVMWGLFSIEPFKSNKNKFNIWYYTKLINESLDDFSGKFIFHDGHASLCGLEFPYIVTLHDSYVRGNSFYKGSFEDLNKESLKFGVTVISREYELAHETGHSLFGLADEYDKNYLTPDYTPPQCAENQAQAEERWGHLVGTIDPFYYQYKSFLQENNITGDNLTEDDVVVGYRKGGCGVKDGDPRVIRPTYKSLMNQNYPILGSVSRERVEQVLNLFSGKIITNENPKTKVNLFNRIAGFFKSIF